MKTLKYFSMIKNKFGFLSKFLFTKKKLIILVSSCIVIWLIKYIIILYELDIQDVIKHPYISFGTIFILGAIKQIIQAIIENYISPQYLTMDGSAGNDIGNIQQTNNTTQQGNNTPDVYQGNGFTYSNGIYTVDDPTNVAANPFINPATNERYPTYKPYSTHLRNAMVHSVREGSSAQVMRLDKFTANEIRFFYEFMENTYPDRQFNAYLNSRPVRKALRDLP